MEKTEVQSLVELVSLAERVGVFESVAPRSLMAGPVNKAELVVDGGVTLGRKWPESLVARQNLMVALEISDNK
jgi:hypothetical protein